jgi:hypothetical protein
MCAVFRVPEALRARLAKVGAYMSTRALADLPGAVVARAALERGLNALEDELGIKRKRAPRQRPDRTTK